MVVATIMATIMVEVQLEKPLVTEVPIVGKVQQEAQLETKVTLVEVFLSTTTEEQIWDKQGCG